MATAHAFAADVKAACATLPETQEQFLTLLSDLMTKHQAGPDPTNLDGAVIFPDGSRAEWDDEAGEFHVQEPAG